MLLLQASPFIYTMYPHSTLASVKFLQSNPVEVSGLVFVLRVQRVKGSCLLKAIGVSADAYRM